MYGYEPPKEPKGSWREVVELSWAAMTVVLPAIFAVIGVMLLTVLFFYCLSIHAYLTVIPLGIAGLVVLAVILRDRRNVARMEAQAARGIDPRSR
jgi:Flp pilus assembly protein TadB